MFSLALGCFGLFFTAVLVLNSFSAQRNVDFVTTAVVTTYFVYSHISPYFVNSLKIFDVITAVVLLIGASVGGVISLLLPEITRGLILGFLVGLYADAFAYGFLGFGNSGKIISVSIFIVSLTASLLVCFQSDLKSFTSILRTSITTGITFTLSIDFFLHGGLLNWVSHVARFSKYTSDLCFQECHIPALLITWGVATLLFFTIHARQAGLLKNWSFMFRSVLTTHVRVPTTDLKPQKQRTFTYPDTLEFNYFDPDNIPPILQPYSDIVFTEVQRLAALYGFQVDSSRNQSEHLLMLLTNEIDKADYGNLRRPVVRIHTKLFANYRKWCAHLGAPVKTFAHFNITTTTTTNTNNGNANGNINLAYVNTNSNSNSELYQNTEEDRNFEPLICDILIWLLIWGEAGNLKHLPESLCFLFHKTMSDTRYFLALSESREMYPGFFLDMVITPIYDVLAMALAKKGDHNDKKTYDDFNEYFWSFQCLKHSIMDHSVLQDESTDHAASAYADFLSNGPVSGIQRVNSFGESKSQHVAVGLNLAVKTYVEKRSWFHPLLNLRRVFEWHSVTFTILASWAFSNQLVWNLAYTLKIISFVFWEISALNILWTCLEVWLLVPNSVISGPSRYGFLIRLLAGYVLLVYQTLYYHWSFSDVYPANVTVNLQGQGDANFWWWQYVWISVIALSVYFFESILCWFPSVTSQLLSSKNDFVQAILNICYPFSQLYIGKKVDVPQKKVFGYIWYWITLIIFKFSFSYKFIVFPVTVPSLELYDDYVNFGEVSFLKTALLFFIWWFPHFLVYLIDLSIWYSLWSSIVGGFSALVDRQGAVRDIKSFRMHFMKAPIAFCQKIMPSNTRVSAIARNIAASTASLNNVTVAAKVWNNKIKASITTSPRMSTPHEKSIPTHASRAQSSADLSKLKGSMMEHFQHSSGFGGKSSSATTDSINKTSSADEEMNKINPLVNDVGQRWVVFATVWNEIIAKLRAGDFINDIENENYLFSTFNWLSKPVYLPLFQTAGCVETAIYAFKDACVEFHKEQEPFKKINVVEMFFNTSMELSMKEAVNESWELSIWLLTQFMGPVHSEDLGKVFALIEIWFQSSTGEMFSRVNPDAIQSIVNHIANISAVLKPVLNKRKTQSVVTREIMQKHSEASQESRTSKMSETSIKPASNIGMKKSVSTGFLQSLSSMGSDTTTGTLDTSGSSSTKQPSSVNSKKKGFAKLQPFRKEFVLDDNTRDRVREEVKGLLNSLRLLLRVKGAIVPQAKDLIDRVTFMLSLESGFLWNDMYASMQLDELAKDSRTVGALSKLHGLLRLRQTQVDTLHPEPLRRLNYFINSLFMEMPLVPQTRYAKDFTTLTPFYSEDVLLSKADLESKNSDSVSTLLYLQTLYKKDWHNFLERRGISDEQSVWGKEHLQETRIWASLRAQTLFRTVDGMMYSEAALRLIAKLEQVSQSDIDILAKLKFNYVVACQVYGQMKRTQDSKAEDIDFLLTRHPNLRVAYIDAIRQSKDGETAYYSVLVKYDATCKSLTNKNGIKEVYRVKLAGNPVLGEGKPENQNHAVVFTRGRFLQAIDMNQDGYFEDALKMRNMLQEFDSGHAILGFREHIFTGSVSSVANYMALQELSFVTLGQRVLANPLCIRQHYGHPDFFDKFFTMTEGGMSKASKGINLSEDVFSGFNATIRGHTIGFKEYAQVGKGRDVGLQQTYKFEAKLAQGNAEQSISRDLARVCDRLDFFRLMSFYYGGIGHYLSNTLVMFTLVVVVYSMVGLALFNEEGVNGRPMHPEGVLQLLLAGLGLLQTMPLFVTLTVEKGLMSAVTEILYMFLSGGPLYFIFHIQTKCYYFSQTLMTGGAAYRPTGRGFVIRHSPFDENYRFFATSHIYLGFEIMIALILFGIHTKSEQYAGLTWSLWLTSISFMFGPFWFNPVTFEWNKLQEDYSQWLRWMEETGGSAEASWAVWWREENSFYKDLSVSWKSCLFIQKFCIWLVIAVGMFQRRFFRDQDEQKRVLELLLVASVYGLGHWCISKLERSLSYAVRRFSSLVLTTSVVLTLLYFYISHGLYVRYSIALYYFFSAVCSLLLLAGFPSINQVYKYHDYLVGHTIFAVLAVFSSLQIGYLQTWLLYHNALSAGVAIEDILKHARKTKERGLVDEEDISTLRAQLQEQERLVKQLYESMGKSTTTIPGLGLNSATTNITTTGGVGGAGGVLSLNDRGLHTISETTGLLSTAGHHPQASFSTQKVSSLPPIAPKNNNNNMLVSSMSKGYGSTAMTDTSNIPFSSLSSSSSIPVPVPVPAADIKKPASSNGLFGTDYITSRTPMAASSTQSSASPVNSFHPSEMSVWQSTPLPVAPALRVSPSNNSISSSNIATLGGTRDGIAFANSTTATANIGDTANNPNPTSKSSLPRNYSAASDTTATSKASNSNMVGSSMSNLNLNLAQLLNTDGVEVRSPTIKSSTQPVDEFVFAQPTSLPPRDV